MRYIEWAFLFLLSGLGIALANFVGFHVAFTDSLPGVCILLVIAIAGVAVSKVVPLKLPIVAYVSILGLLAASPISPCREFVIASAGKINFTAPLTMVGAHHGRRLRRNLHQRPDPHLRKTGLEDDPDRHLCHDRNLCVLRTHCSDRTDTHRSYLGGLLWLIYALPMCPFFWRTEPF